MHGADVVMKAMHAALAELSDAERPTAVRRRPRDLHLFDLGSGVGKVQMQAVLGGYFGYATGIELCPRRHRIAELCLAEIEKGRTQAIVDGVLTETDTPKRQRSAARLVRGRARCVEGNVTIHRLYSNDADVAYISCLLYTSPSPRDRG